MQYEHLELQPIETCTQALNRRSRCIGRSPAKCSCVPKRPARSLSAGADPLAEVRDRAGPERDVHLRVELEDPLPLGLGVAAADRDDEIGVLALARAGVAQVGGELRVGLLADRARVEDEHVGVCLRGRLPEPERLEHALDPLGVVGVHLAAERGDVVPRIARGSYPTACYLATSIARLSRITVTFTWPGYSSWSSISRAISCESSTAPSSSISVGSTMTRISRPAWSAYAFATPGFAVAISSSAPSRLM